MVQRHKVVLISSSGPRPSTPAHLTHQGAEACPPPDHGYVWHCGCPPVRSSCSAARRSPLDARWAKSRSLGEPHGLSFALEGPAFERPGLAP